ncbi:heterokaryon incompatibility protein-domain-containing protein [Trametes meyenii]|nr:heterokaryon incompatibility protein-domain-containing protein [Trametes meyenii]
MWLLHTINYKLHYFVGEGDKPPRYTILSHCWDPDPDNEVVFADMRDLELARTKPGWRKVMHACHAAHECGFDWVWIDTCCIDKSSSAELSQAINSMFAWYAAASVCLAYLNDVDADEDPQAPDSTFRASRWFKRGWTLQELVAPRSLFFYSRDWRKIGCKTALAATVSDITTIEPRVLCCSWVHFGRISIARRMSWAAGRKTSRPEDRAYSLMGIFYVNMPTVYGEGGRKAFHRLQMEIIRQSPDHSIFAWGVPLHRPLSSVGLHGTQMRRSSLLASSPDGFRNSATFTPIPMERIEGTSGTADVTSFRGEESSKVFSPASGVGVM